MSKEIDEYKKKAEQGDAEAQCSLGDCYRLGQGVEQDYSAAFKWYQLSAEQGYSDAQYCLGLLYGEGAGVERNSELAVDWYRKSAEQDNEETVGALNIEELFSIHSLHYEVLEGDKAGISSIRVNDQYRIKFTVFNQEAETVVYICNILESSVRMLCRKYIDEVSDSSTQAKHFIQ